MEKNNAVSFESSLKDLEKIVSVLEKGDLALEDQLKAFEKGVSLSRDCMKRLEEVEKRVEQLVQSSEGKLTTAPFDPGTAHNWWDWIWVGHSFGLPISKDNNNF